MSDRDFLPVDLNEKTLPLTEAQEKRLTELEKEGWIAVTGPEKVFDGAMLLEGPTSHIYLKPDGTTEEQSYER